MSNVTERENDVAQTSARTISCPTMLTRPPSRHKRKTEVAVCLAQEKKLSICSRSAGSCAGSTLETTEAPYASIKGFLAFSFLYYYTLARWFLLCRKCPFDIQNQGAKHCKHCDTVNHLSLFLWQKETLKLEHVLTCASCIIGNIRRRGRINLQSSLSSDSPRSIVEDVPWLTLEKLGQ